MREAGWAFERGGLDMREAGWAFERGGLDMREAGWAFERGGLDMREAEWFQLFIRSPARAFLEIDLSKSFFAGASAAGLCSARGFFVT
jgi:hypothetical protein